MLSLLFSCYSTPSIPLGDSLPPQTESSSHEFIIVGGGASGIAAAKTLIESGHTPLILEKESQLGGAGIHAGRYFAVDTPWQSQNNIEDDLDIALSEWTTLTGCAPHPSLNDFLSSSSALLEWLGEEYFDDVNYAPDAGWRIHPLNPDVGPPPLRLWAESLYEYAQTNTEVVGLIVDNGRVLGVRTSTTDYFSNNVILATGGFGRNLKHVQSVYPTLTEENWYSEAWPKMLGSGLDILDTIGSLDLHLGLHVHGVEDVVHGQPEVMLIGAINKTLIVNQNGERHFNEEDFERLSFGGQHFGEDQFYAIFDSELWANTAFNQFSYNTESDAVLFSSEEYLALGDVVSSDHWEEIAEDIPVPVNQLIETVTNYNTFIDSGTDPLGKDLSGIPALRVPPYYALPLRYSTGRSFGVVNNNEDMRVCNENNCIEGLYVTGELQGLMCGSDGGFTGSITAALYSGRKAAIHAKTNQYD